MNRRTPPTHSKVLAYVERLRFLKSEATRLSNARGKTFELHRTVAEDPGTLELVRQELARLSQEKKAADLEIQENETFIDSQPAPREIRRKIEEGMVEFQKLWKKSTGSQKNLQTQNAKRPWRVTPRASLKMWLRFQKFVMAHRPLPFGSKRSKTRVL